MTVYSDRPVTLFMIPADEGTTVLHPEQTMFKCDNFIDIGALCFLKRSNEKRKKGKGRKVELGSFDKSRATAIHALINKILLESATRRLAAPTLQAQYLNFIRFIDWCDSNGHARVLASIDEGRASLRAFVPHLRHLTDVQMHRNSTAYGWQGQIVRALNLHFDISNISLGINLIVTELNLRSHTEVPTQDRLAKFLSFNTAVFNGLCNSILDEKPFPFNVPMPQFVGYDNDQMWIFPIETGWVRHPESPLIDIRNLSTDFVAGRIKRIEEVVHLYSSHKSADGAIRKTNAKISMANVNLRSIPRLRMAALANLSFIQLFEAITGANRADIGRIEWSEDVADQIAKPDTVRQGFRSLKVRANNKDVFYQIGIIYFPLFRKFLQLRSWILGGISYDRLFFNNCRPTGNAPPEPPTRLLDSHYARIHTASRQMYPGFRKIALGNRKTRAAKQDHAIRNYDPSTSARIMQHSLTTALGHYSNGSVEVAREEMGHFLHRVHEVVADGRHLTKMQENRAMGSCISINQPHPISPYPAVTPDCKLSEGCLFCDKYRVHADEKDLRKLLSAKFVVEQTSILAASAEEYDRVFGATITRIDQILLEISSADPTMINAIDRISKEVDKGELENYWSVKLEELVEAGIL